MDTRLISNVLIALASQVLGRGSLIFFGMAVARFWGAEEFATFSYVLLTATFISVFASAGLAPSLGRFIAQALIDKSLELREEIFASGILLAGFLSAITIILFLIPPALIGLPRSLSTALLALVALSMLLNAVANALANGAERFKAAAFAALVQAVLLAVGGFVSIAINKYELIIPSLALSFLIPSLFLMRAMQSTFSELGIRITKINNKAVLRVLAFATPVMASSLLFSSALWLCGRTLISTDGENSQFAQFAMSLHWFSLLLLVPNMVNRVLAPTITRQAFIKSLKHGKNPVVMSSALSFVTSLITFGALAGLADWIVTLYALPPEAKYTLLVCACAAVVASPINSLGNAMIASRNQTQWLSLASVWWVVLVAMLFFTSGQGAVGVSIALLVSYCIHLPLVFTASRRLEVI